MKKFQRIYTKFKAPDGDEIILTFRSEESVNQHKKENPTYKLIYKDTVHPEPNKKMKNTIFTYLRALDLNTL
jgi:hypothetical protein